MRSLSLVAFALAGGCTGDILPIQLPGPQFFIEVGNLPGPMQEVRGGFEGPVAVGGGTEPLVLERRLSGWIPLAPPDEWRGTVLDAAVAQGSLFLVGRSGRFAAGGLGALRMVSGAEDRALRGVFARAADDVFIAAEGAVLHYDGATLAPIELESPASDSDFFAVWGSGTSVFAAGSDGVVLTISGSSAVLTETGTTATLRALHGRSRMEIYAVGGDDQGAVLRFDGVTWTDLALPSMPPLLAVYAGRSGVWVSGIAGYLARWDGERWAELATPSIASLTGVYEQDGEVFLTAGDADDLSASGIVLRYGE